MRVTFAKRPPLRRATAPVRSRPSPSASDAGPARATGRTAVDVRSQPDSTRSAGRSWGAGCRHSVSSKLPWWRRRTTRSPKPAQAGKTRAIVARFHRRVTEEPRKGIALVSFTNGAIDEVRKRCGERADALLAPHFVGTFDSFINRFITRPLDVQQYGQTPRFSESWTGLKLASFRVSSLEPRRHPRSHGRQRPGLCAAVARVHQGRPLAWRSDPGREPRPTAPGTTPKALAAQRRHPRVPADLAYVTVTDDIAARPALSLLLVGHRGSSDPWLEVFTLPLVNVFVRAETGAVALET